MTLYSASFSGLPLPGSTSFRVVNNHPLRFITETTLLVPIFCIHTFLIAVTKYPIGNNFWEGYFGSLGNRHGRGWWWENTAAACSCGHTQNQKGRKWSWALGLKAQLLATPLPQPGPTFQNSTRAEAQVFKYMSLWAGVLYLNHNIKVSLYCFIFLQPRNYI